MQALFFEVTPRPGHDDHYFRIAAALKTQLESSGGLLFLDRYRSETRPGTILSYQHWVDEAALVKWRGDAKHHRAQSAGRNVHFADYRIRLGEIVDGFMSDDSDAKHLGQLNKAESVSGETPLVMAVECVGRAFLRGEPFKSVNRDGVYASILHIANREEADEILRDAKSQGDVTAAILCGVARDYGMYERDDAPQEFPPVEAGVS